VIAEETGEANLNISRPPGYRPAEAAENRRSGAAVFLPPNQG
jgi:hypothetical protein